MALDEPPSTQPSPHRDAAPATPRHRRAQLVWGCVAALVMAVGLLGTNLVIERESTSARELDDRNFVEDSSAVISLLRAELQRQDEFLISASSFSARNPDMTTDDLQWWVESVRAAERYPNLLALEFVRYVEPDELAEYAERVASDPDARAGDGPFVVAPPGERDQYCFVQAVGLRRGPAVAPDSSLDLCADPAVLHATRTAAMAGMPTFHELEGELGTPTRVAVPVYAGGAVPPDAHARDLAYLGEVVLHLDAQALLGNALASHPGLSAEMRFRDDVSELTIAAGQVDVRAHTMEASLIPGWTLSVVGEPGTGGGVSGRTIALVGSIIAGLSAAFVYVLGTSRARALDLVDEATAELRHLALHDPLTGLPNRTLIGDRLEALVARCRRDGTTPAALFVDLDGFKEVNDSLGHAAGDDLLRDVARRLTRTLRDTDTIGRMGGDEFVVLVDSGSTPLGPEVVADRLLESLRLPFASEHTPELLGVTASVGIAVGDRDNPDDLLRESDMALYDAKDAGKDCWRVHGDHRVWATGA